MIIRIKDHSSTGEKLIEVSSASGLIATIIPRENEIVIVSKYITDVIKDMAFPPKITFKIKLGNKKDVSWLEKHKNKKILKKKTKGITWLKKRKNKKKASK